MPNFKKVSLSLYILTVFLYVLLNTVALADTPSTNPHPKATSIEVKVPAVKGEGTTATGDKVILTLDNIGLVVKENTDVETAIQSTKVIKVETNLLKPKDEVIEAGIGDEITFTVENLHALVKKAKDSNQTIIPYINNIAIKGIAPLSIDTTSGKVVYVFTRTNESKDAWASLLGNRKFLEYSKTLPISIGIDSEAINSKEKFKFILMRQWSLWIWIGACLALLFLLIYMGKKTTLLRATNNDSPYSLGKSQMLVWSYVVMISYLFIWIVIRDFNSVNETALILLGISLVTGGGALLVDSSKINGKNELIAQKDSLQTIIDDLQTKISSLQGIPGDQLIKFQQDLNDKTMQKAIIEQKIANHPLIGGISTSNSFFEDILQDADGWSLHRVQMFFWTIILVGIFLSNVYPKLSMPDFNATLLTLMGISSGTYLGFKFPERS